MAVHRLHKVASPAVLSCQAAVYIHVFPGSGVRLRKHVNIYIYACPQRSHSRTHDLMQRPLVVRSDRTPVLVQTVNETSSSDCSDSRGPAEIDLCTTFHPSYQQSKSSTCTLDVNCHCSTISPASVLLRSCDRPHSFLPTCLQPSHSLSISHSPHRVANGH